MDLKARNEFRIKARVISGYILFLLLILATVYITIISFQNLTRSADTLARPNKRIQMLHEILFSIHSAESSIRSYTLTQNETHLNSYFGELAKINILVDSLYTLSATDSIYRLSIDTINQHLAQKTVLLESFIEFKSQDRNSVFYEHALSRILQVTEEQEMLKEMATSVSVRERQVAAKDTMSDLAPTYESKRNFFQRVRTFFTGREEEPLETLNLPTSEPVLVETIKDTITTYYRQADNLLGDIEAILQDARQSALQEQNLLNQKENSILLKDKKVMDKIWKVITHLQQYESGRTAQEAEYARETVRETTLRIIAIIFACIITLLLFSYLISKDMAQSRYYKQQLIAEIERTENLVKVKQRFMANMSHEVRTPLNAILGFARQLKKSQLNDLQTSFTHSIDKSAQHLLEIVNDILDFSKIEAGRLLLEAKPLRIQDVLDDVYDFVAIIAWEKKLHLAFNHHFEEDDVYLGDTLRIKQILLNLIGNALKFTTKGSVIITAKPLGDSIEIIVSDTGPGIAPEQQKIIFEEFSQADTASTRRHTGTGLGLSISQRLALLMGGQIFLQSTPGKGSVFTVKIFLPKTTKKPEHPTRTQAFQHGSLSHLFVLAIDDDPSNRELMTVILNNCGVQHTLASHAAEALEQCRLQKFDLIITDIQMPGISGLDLARLLRQDTTGINHNTPLLACTADITTETRDHFLQAGINDYILKPFDEVELIGKIANLAQKSATSDASLLSQAKDSQVTTFEKQGNALFSLDHILAFTGDNAEAAKQVLTVFMEDTRQNLLLLDQLQHHGDPEKQTGKIAHKMLNMYRMLNIHQAIPSLEYLQKMNYGESQSPEEIKQALDQLKDISTRVLDRLSHSDTLANLTLKS